MYRSLKQIQHYSLLTKNEEACKLEDLFFNETTWKTQYLVVKTGSFFSARNVLLNPVIVEKIIDADKKIQLLISNDHVKKCPSVNSVLPISLEAELLLAKYWEWIPKDAEGPLPPEAGHSIEVEAETESKDLSERAAESKLRSYEEVKGYTIYAPDGHFGHIEDFLFDDDWLIRYAVVDTRNWIPGKRVLLPVGQIEEVKWAEHSLHVEASCELVKSAPAYDESKGVTPEDEEAVRNHFK